jgi:CRISPR system Cascade subunit CasC
MIIELHILQNFAPSNLNRDDTNSPKECQFGGYRRARISSQCIKRTVRQSFNSLISTEFLAKRTKKLAEEIIRRLVKEDKSEEDAKKASIALIQAAGLKFKDGDKTEYLLFIGENEIEAAKNIIVSNWVELIADKPDDKKVKAIGDELKKKLDGGKAADLALFGRMLADLPDNNIEAACQVAHAISTHKVGVEFDFYTAVDDLQNKAESGAGMMGDIEFNSACYYRYSNIDLNQLKKNLDNDEGLSNATVAAFIRASVSAIPTGKQNSFAAQNPPDFIMAVVRNNGAWSLANAFVKPIKEGGSLVADSIRALVDYWDKLNTAYGSETIRVRNALSLSDFDTQRIDRVNSIQDLINCVNASIQ